MLAPLSASTLVRVALLASFTIGCTKHSALFCDEQTPCTDPSRPFCDLTGEFPASEGHGRTCIANPFPDAAVADAATADAQTITPPVVNGQFADLVLGQPDFNSNESGARTADRFTAARGVATNGNILWVRDRARILQWNSIPFSNGQAADLVIGQPDFTSTEFGTSASRLGFEPGGVSVSTSRGLLCDGARVLVFDPLPQVNDPDSFLVVGQSNMTDRATATTQSGLSFAEDAWTDGDRLAIADMLNMRVLLWNDFPASNGDPADVVLGQPDFNSNEFPNPPTRSSMNRPQSVHFDGQRLYVADTANNRVLIWQGWPASNGQPADVIVGQVDGESNLPNRGGTRSETSLVSPSGVATARESLFIADGNQRVLVFTPIPESDGAAAARVLGQDDFTTMVDGSPSPNRFRPWHLSTSDDAVYVVDLDASRVLRFSFQP